MLSMPLESGSGLDALRLGLLALEIGPGDEVIVPANTYIATAFAVSEVGADVVLVDCDPATYNVDPDAVAAAVTSRTRALLPVHFTGQAAEMRPLLELAASNRPRRRRGRRAGSRNSVRGTTVWVAQQARLFQLLSGQESRRVRRRRDGDDERPGRRRENPSVAQLR